MHGEATTLTNKSFRRVHADGCVERESFTGGVCCTWKLRSLRAITTQLASHTASIYTVTLGCEVLSHYCDGQIKVHAVGIGMSRRCYRHVVSEDFKHLAQVHDGPYPRYICTAEILGRASVCYKSTQSLLLPIH